jgi:hypothetical protein
VTTVFFSVIYSEVTSYQFLIRNKQEILIDDMIEREVKIPGIADTRVKGKHILKTHMDYTIIFSGVNDSETAKHGVGFILDSKIAKHILENTYLSERIIVLRLIIGDTKNNIHTNIRPLQQQRRG